MQVALLAPDVVVMDVSMPGLSGSQATARLRLECPAVRVLALTVHEDRGYLRQLLAAGAAGYVLKRSPKIDPQDRFLATKCSALGLSIAPESDLPLSSNTASSITKCNTGLMNRIRSKL